MPEATRAPRHIAIVGTAPGSRDLVPHGEPGLEIWGLSVSRRFLPRGADRWFELHTPEFIEAEGPEFTTWLVALREPVYMWEQYEEIPSSRRFPLEALVAEFGPYFTSTMAYVIAFAIHELTPSVPGDEIRLYGVDMMASEEHGHQREGVLYYLGLAEGRGIRTVLPSVTPLRKAPLYGRPDPGADERAEYAKHLSGRRDLLKAKHAELAVFQNALNGGLDILTQLREHLPEDVYTRFDTTLRRRRSDINGAFNGVLGQLKELQAMRGFLGSGVPPDAPDPEPEEAVAA